jgi:hypothetical protein
MMVFLFGPNGIAFCKGGNIYIVKHEQDEGNTIIVKLTSLTLHKPQACFTPTNVIRRP